MAGEIRPGHFKGERGFPSGMVVIQANRVLAGAQRSLAGEGLHPASILRCERRHFLAIDGERRPVRLEEELIVAGLLDVEPALEAEGHVVVDAIEVAEGEITRVTAAFGLDRLVSDAFPDLTAIHGVVQVARHARVAEEVMCDAFQFAGGQLQVRHPSRWAALVRLTEEIDQTAETVFRFQRPQRHGFCGKRLAALRVAGRVARGATAGVEKFFALGGGDAIRRLWGESRCLQRQQEMRELLGGRGAFRLGQFCQEVGHRRAWLGRMRRADERLEVGRIDPLRYLREARRLLGLQVGSRRGGMTSDTVEFLEE